MANYKYLQYLKQSDHAAFDALHPPGTSTPHSGIYRCEPCADNIRSTHRHPPPPENHHQQNPPAPIRWRLIAATH